MEKKLIQQLNDYSKEYYKGNPIVSDSTFDALEEQLRAINPNSSYFTKIRETATGYGTKHKHIYAEIGSIDKIHSIEQSKLLNKVNISLSAKLDGTSLVAYYKDGELSKALTRGDGTMGMDVTAHFRMLSTKYRLVIPTNFTGAIRGEIIFSNLSWDMFKFMHPEAKLPRNSGTGLINQKSPSSEITMLDFVTYDVIASSIAFTEVFEFLNSLGFKTAPHIFPQGKITEKQLEELYKQWSSIYPLDGIVIREAIVTTIKDGLLYSTLNQEAFKFQATTKIATVTSITWGLGRTGKLIPVIQIEPTELSGAIVTNVTGHNAKNIQDNQIGIGSTIAVMRSGEVIPYMTEVVTTAETIIPTNCPHCNSILEWTDTGVDLLCVNPLCQGQEYHRMTNYIQVMCKDIKGIGDSFLKGFIEYFSAYASNLEELLLSIFTHDPSNTISTLGNANNKIAKEVIAKLTSKVQSSSNFLRAMSIKLLGNTMAQELSQSPIIADIFTALKTSENLHSLLSTALPGKVALIESIIKSRSLIEPILRLFEDNKVLFDFNTITAPTPQKLRLYAVTGSLSLPRKKLQEELLTKGWQLTESLSKAEVLINNDIYSNSSKNIKAKAQGLQILTEQQFRSTYLTKETQ